MDDFKETGRVEAFSDGVFAVAITLLVLNIQPPSLSTPLLLEDSALRDYLRHQLPMLLGFCDQLCHYRHHVDKSS